MHEATQASLWGFVKHEKAHKLMISFNVELYLFKAAWSALSTQAPDEKKLTLTRGFATPTEIEWTMDENKTNEAMENMLHECIQT